ncbi:hypothetical protein DHW03_18170 [Pedobacter yonginense]|uniref:Uncharacterized protein n=1 Tax=Pedobacter yonginense TaxID=651869 RepID=A0A317EIQ0_9SPHI|nr:hypothetical protein [Pedobacter yonginense]PWS25979.1 hypothetical protein DHW03_18170 [Pedobacter yonginense]
MKAILYILTIIVTGFNYSVLAQSVSPISIAQVNGTEAIAKLREARFTFNKASMSSRKTNLSSLPQSEYIFDKPGMHAVSFEGVKFVLKDQKVVSINGMTASDEVLAVITEKLLTLDRLQYFYSEKSNQEYLNAVKSNSYIFHADRLFFAALKILGTTVKDIAAIAKPEISTTQLALGIAKLPKPNIDQTIMLKDFQNNSIIAK